MKFKVTFTDLEKVMTVEAPNVSEAEKWAFHQLIEWGKDSNFYVEKEEKEIPNKGED